MSAKPTTKPQNPCFSSGPCAKRPGWSVDVLKNVLGGRSHRSAPGKALLKDVIEKQRDLLGIPADYRIGIVPASDTGAVEMALWSMLGARGVDALVWESFSKGWMADITQHLKLDNVTVHEAGYGDLPDLSKVNSDNDTVFVWNGTTSGVRVPNGDWIADNREGLTFCDATSAVFAYDLPWEKLDVTTWSWQKALGGEAAHGMIVLSPRAVERLETYTPPRPLPKIFRMVNKGKISEGIFKGLTINTPSMLALADVTDALDWAKSIGGLPAMIARSRANYEAIESWVNQTDWVEFLAPVAENRSTTAITLKITDPDFTALSAEDQTAFIAEFVKVLDNEGAAYDIKNYKDAPSGLRIWGGATVETRDIEALTPWFDWAFAEVRAA